MNPNDARAFVQKAVDQPVSTSLELGNGRLLGLISPALVGVFLVAAATLLATLLVTRHGVRVDGLRAAARALGVVLPVTLLIAAAARLKLPPQALVGALSVGLLHAGLVSVLFLPLLAFLAVFTGEEAGLRALLSGVIPAVGLIAAVVVPYRTLTSVDRSFLGRLVAITFVFGALGLFADSFVHLH